MGEWARRRIGTLGRVVTGKTPPTGDHENFDGSYPFITIPDLDGRLWIEHTARSLSDKGARTIKSCLLPGGTVVMSCIATIGRCGITAKPSFTNQQINSVIPDAVVDSEFLYYVFTRLGRELDAAGGGGSVYTNVSKSRFADIEVMIPVDIREQRAIARIAGALDDKIELNRRMNETLDTMARQIYKSWFINFDPVRAKAKGLDLGLPADIVALFPDTFQDSDLGEIPEGWKVADVGLIADVIDCLHSKKPDRQDNGLPLLQLSNIGGDGIIDMRDAYFITESDYRQWVSRIEASPGDCVITNVGRVGSVAQMPAGQKAALGRNMTGVRSRPSFYYPTFLVECLLSETMREEIALRTDTGTILDALNVRNIPQLRLVLPPNSLLRVFEGIARPLRARMEQDLLESHSLASLRDTLLPGLMSGQLEVTPLGGV